MLPIPVFLGFPGGSDGKESDCNAGDLDSIPGLGRASGAGHDNPHQYSCLENSREEKPGGCSASVHKEPDTTERLSTAQHGCYIGELLFSLHVYFTSH